MDGKMANLKSMKFTHSGKILDREKPLYISTLLFYHGLVRTGNAHTGGELKHYLYVKHKSFGYHDKNFLVL